MRTPLLFVTCLLAFAPPLAHADASPFTRFPRIDQLHEVLADGSPSENAKMNCVPASIAAGLQFLTGRAYSAASVKHAVYGEQYTGPTQIYRYLDWVQGQGVEMTPLLSHDSTKLVGELRALLEKGVPAVLSIPGDVRQPPSDLLHPQGVTHVVIAAGFDDQGNIRVMNPWGGVWLSGDDAFWASRLCYGELWPMSHDAAARATISAIARDSKPSGLGALAVKAVGALGATPSAVFTSLRARPSN